MYRWDRSESSAPLPSRRSGDAGRAVAIIGVACVAVVAGLTAPTVRAQNAAPSQPLAGEAREAKAAAPRAPSVPDGGQNGERDIDAAYALGLLTARGLDQLQYTDEDWERFLAGLAALREHGAPANLATRLPALEAFQRERATAAIADERRASEAWLADAAARDDTETIQNGIVIQILDPGSGREPQPDDLVELRFAGWLRDGTRFDSSEARGGPAVYTFPRMIGCWYHSVRRLRVGGKLMAYCPALMSYGGSGIPPLVPPGSALRFELELLSAEPPPTGDGEPSP